MKDAPAGKKFYRTIMDDTMPGGPVERTIEYVAPFDRCDREQDYETAWKFFEEKYGKIGWWIRPALCAKAVNQSGGGQIGLILENCNNITQGRAIIVEGALNIKYAINGTGKSTISKAITAVVNQDDKALDLLVPYQFANDPTHRPKWWE